MQCFFFWGGGRVRGDVQLANGTWDMILSCGPSSRVPSPNTLEKTVWRAKRKSTWEAKNIRDLLGFRNYYSWALLPESAIGPTITSVYFFIDSMTALVVVDFNCASDQRLCNIYNMFPSAKSTLKMICFPQVPPLDPKLVWRVYMKTRRRQEKPVRSLHVLFNFKMAVTPDRTLHLLQITRTIVKYAYLFITIISLLSSRTIAESTKGEH